MKHRTETYELDRDGQGNEVYVLKNVSRAAAELSVCMDPFGETHGSWTDQENVTRKQR
ncbi:Hypothetical predicted protein, partial [Pelobates cultripes]